MSATAKQQVEALAREHHAEVEDLSNSHVDDITLYLPKGKNWHATGCHVLVARQYSGGKDTLWRELLADMRKGVTDCDNPQCEMCEGEE